MFPVLCLNIVIIHWILSRLTMRVTADFQAFWYKKLMRQWLIQLLFPLSLLTANVTAGHMKCLLQSGLLKCPPTLLFSSQVTRYFVKASRDKTKKRESRFVHDFVEIGKNRWINFLFIVMLFHTFGAILHTSFLSLSHSLTHSLISIGVSQLISLSVNFGF